MTLLLEEKRVNGVIIEFNFKTEEPAANATTTEQAAFQDWNNHHGVARSTILLGIEPRIHAKYTVTGDAMMFWEQPGSAHKAKLKLNILEITEDHWSITPQACGDGGNYPSWIHRKHKNYNLCAEPSTADTVTDVNAKKIRKIREQEHIFYLHRGKSCWRS